MFDPSSPTTHVGDYRTHEAEFLNAAEAAAYLHMELSTLYKYTSLRLVPHYKRSGKLLFDVKELATWLRRGRRDVINEHSAINHMTTNRKRGTK